MLNWTYNQTFNLCETDDLPVKVYLRADPIHWGTTHLVRIEVSSVHGNLELRDCRILRQWELHYNADLIDRMAFDIAESTMAMRLGLQRLEAIRKQLYSA